MLPRRRGRGGGACSARGRRRPGRSASRHDDGRRRDGSRSGGAGGRSGARQGAAGCHHEAEAAAEAEDEAGDDGSRRSGSTGRSGCRGTAAGRPGADPDGRPVIRHRRRVGPAGGEGQGESEGEGGCEGEGRGAGEGQSPRRGAGPDRRPRLGAARSRASRSPPPSPSPHRAPVRTVLSSRAVHGDLSTVALALALIAAALLAVAAIGPPAARAVAGAHVGIVAALDDRRTEIAVAALSLLAGVTILAALSRWVI